jgi:hypothetical protein
MNLGVGGMYRVDASSETAVAVCACGWRSGPLFSREAARTTAEEHLTSSHPEYGARVRNARSKRRTRRSED